MYISLLTFPHKLNFTSFIPANLDSLSVLLTEFIISLNYFLSICFIHISFSFKFNFKITWNFNIFNYYISKLLKIKGGCQIKIFFLADGDPSLLINSNSSPHKFSASSIVFAIVAELVKN